MEGKYPVVTLCGSTRFKEQFMEAVAEERKQLSEKADRRYRHITSIIKRNPNAVSRVHKESINEIKEIIANRKAKRNR